jgi:hypothetical protein
MGNQADTTPEVAAAVGFGVVSSALAMARVSKPHLVEWLEEAQLVSARRLLEFSEVE